jgi:hypothetical protein
VKQFQGFVGIAEGAPNPFVLHASRCAFDCRNKS